MQSSLLLRARAPVSSPRSVTTPKRSAAVMPLAATAVPTEYKTVAPLGDRIFVKIDEAEATSAGGILLPSAAQVKSTQGVVAATPKGGAKSLSEGDRVLYSKYAGTEIKMGKDEFVLLKEDDVIGKMNGSDVGKLSPLGDRVLLKALETKKETDGGVILATEETERPTLGKVIAVGPGKADDDGKAAPLGISTGATVLYSKYAGSEFTGEDGSEYVVISASDVLATLA